MEAELKWTFTPKSLRPLMGAEASSGDKCKLKLLNSLEVEVATRYDCGGLLRMSVTNYPDGENSELQLIGHKNSDVRLDPGTDWHFEECTSVFEGEPFSIDINIMCKDDRFWSGHYGTKVKRIRFALHHVE